MARLDQLAGDGRADPARCSGDEDAHDASYPELRARELTKLDSLTSAFARQLRADGVASATASLTAAAGIAIFKVALDRWVDDDRRSFAELVRESSAALQQVVTTTSGGAQQA